MQSGFNTNIRHRGVRFHVQTEDSGVERPRITTHLFWGGDILASAVDDYSALLEGAAPTAPGALTDAVRGRMQAQHKSMLKALCAGAHDTAVLVVPQHLGKGGMNEMKKTSSERVQSGPS